MKKNLLLGIILVLSAIAKVQAQACTVLSNLSIDIKNVSSGPAGCQVTIDASFTAEFNNGNEYAFIHLWETAPVNNYPALTYVDPPTSAQLANAIASIVIKSPGKSNATLYSQYPPNTSIPVKFSGVSFTKTGNTFTLKNIVVNLSTCGVPVTVKGDVWASQANGAQTVHCANGGLITILFNNPIISGIKQCNGNLNLSFKNDHPTLSTAVTTNAFIDVNSNGSIDGGDIEITSALSAGVRNFNLAAQTTLAFSSLSYLPYSGQLEYRNKPIIVRAYATAPGAATVIITKTITTLGDCAALPVTFNSFTAKRDDANVLLKWVTSSEQNNTGFAIERGVNGNWSQLAFIASQAAGGNSNTNLTYAYEDFNNTKGISQYRIKQIDFDGKFNYTEVRSVSGKEQTGRVVIYPNPSSNGKVSVILEQTNGFSDISLIDMTGRTIKQWKAITNSLQIENLVPGIYHLRIIDRETGKQSVEKIVINNR